MERIVVFRPGALGDTLLTVDALAGLRQQFPDAWLELVGHGEAGRLLRTVGVVDEATDFDAAVVMGLFADPPRMPSQWEAAALVVLWMRDTGSLVQSFKAGGAHVIIAAIPEPDDDIHVAEHLVRTLMPAGVRPVEGPATLHLSGTGAGTEASGLALVHPGSGAARKNWPPERFAALCRRIAMGGLVVELVEGPADRDAVALLAAALGPSVKISCPVDLAELARLLASARLVVGNDSGVSHLAGRLAVPTVAVFGATDPRRWRPRGARVEVVGSAGSWPSSEAVWAACQRAIGEPPRYAQTRALAERWSRQGYVKRGN